MSRPALGRVFLASLLAVTALPLIGIPIAAASGPTHVTFPGWWLIVLATGHGHGASSAFFYLDREFRPLLHANRIRCLWSIALLPVSLLLCALLLSVFFGPWGIFGLFVFHNAWLFHHYQRQNYGLISLAGAHAAYGPLPAGLNPVLNLAAVAGVVGALGLPGFYPPIISWLLTPAVHHGCRMVAMGAYGLAFLGLGVLVVREPRLRSTPSVLGAIVCSCAFFLPALVSDDGLVAFLPYAIAHGAQYLLMVAVLSARSPLGWRGLGGMVAVAAGLALLYDHLSSWPFVVVVAGLVEVHFLLDARVWRLRDPIPREVMRRRFDFLFARPFQVPEATL